MNSENSVIFLTGATGLLGSYLLKILLQKGHNLYVLARSKNNKSAKERVQESVTFWDKDIFHDKLKNLKIVEGDIIYPNFGIRSSKLIDEITKNIEIIYHSAALAKLKAPFKIINEINVNGTKNVLNFAIRCQEKGRLKKINHISTAYVAGTTRSIYFSEDMLELGQDFNNVYEKTKYHAELLVREYLRKGLNISIFRPSLVMGDSQEGKTTDFRLFYEPLHFFSQEIYDEFPADVNAYQNMINIDTVAHALFLLGDREEVSVYHLVSPENTNIGFFIELASNFFKFKMPKLVPIEDFSFDCWTPLQKILAEPFIAYFNYKTTFLSGKTQNILLSNAFNYPAVQEENILRIFTYCKMRRFIRK